MKQSSFPPVKPKPTPGFDVPAPFAPAPFLFLPCPSLFVLKVCGQINKSIQYLTPLFVFLYSVCIPCDTHIGFSNLG